ncbi:MAG: hypothetical protein IJW86_09515 [Clostridia bacterium]|nr:hypothetical protein [Clostridia bacterium]
MKKLISLLLALIMVFALAAPAFAIAPLNPDYEVPTILLRGDGTDIYDATGEKIVWPVSLGDEEGDKDILIDSIIDVIFPHLVTGLLTGNYEGYYEAFYQAVLPLFDEAQLDCNGDASNGTIIDPEKTRYNVERMTYSNIRHWDGDYRYDMDDYSFYYDWRRSPLETAKELDAYITRVMQLTGAKQINLIGLCLGGCPVTAYLDLYLDKLANGTAPYIKNVFYDATVMNDCDAFTDAFRGKLDLNADGLKRFMDEYADKDENTFEGIGDTVPFLNEILFTTYDLLRETGVATDVFGSFEDFYAVIAGGLVPKIAIAAHGSFPGYWASVQPEYYEEAKAFVFGEPGSEMYEEYKGLIAKNDKYFEEVGYRTREIITACQESGIHFGAVAKYGRQLFPFVESQDEIADGLVTLESASFGATTSLVGKTLSEDYIAERVALGFGDYISADKQVDLSTSFLKDTTWIIKNSSHHDWGDEEEIVNNFIWSTGLTTESEGAHPRFMLFDPATETLSELTADNKDETIWEDTPTLEEESTIWTKLAALMRWLTTMLKFILHLTNENPGPAPV